MRIGSGDSNSKSKNQTTSYEDQNNQLKKLHEQRMKRQQNNKSIEMQSESCQSVLFKKEFKASKQVLKYPHNLFLNSLLSDQRNIKQKPNSIALSSLFQQNPTMFATGISKNIKSVLMTSYGFVMDVLGPIAQSGVPFTVVNDTQQVGQGKIERNYSGYKNMTLVSPPRTNKGYGVFHSKIWLIKFGSFLRVVIGTGNQHVQDWIMWLNAYWYQDFPLKGMRISDYVQKQSKEQQKQQKKSQQIKPTKKQQQKKLTKNEKVFNQQIKNMISLDDDQDEIIFEQKKKPQPLKKKQSKKQLHQKQPQTKEQSTKPFNYDEDFKQTLNMVLNKMFPTAYDLQKQLGINLNNYQISDINVVLIPSIPGRHTVKDGQMKKYGMAKVKSVIKELGPKYKKGSLSYNSSSLGVVEQNFLRQIYFSFLPNAQSFSSSNYKVIYPTYKYITQQTCGEASVLYLKKQNYYKSELKKQVFYHYEPSYKNPVKGAIPHLKTVVVECMDPQSWQQKNKCIFYVGSHNMTKAAWGTYQKSDSQISFSNSQLGLLFLNMEKQQLFNWLPYRYPPRKYGDYEKPFLRDM